MPELLWSKITAPRLRQAAIARQRLTARLDEGLAGSLILVCAPAGYGKSTLVADWLAARAGDAHAAWLTLDAEDNDANRFATYLEAALERAVPELREPLRASLGSSGVPEVGGQGLVVLLNTLAALDRPLVTVLDDYHLVTSPAIHNMLLALLHHLPETMTIVLLTRADPPLPLSRLRSQGSVATIRAADLRFEPQEASAFLSAVMGLTLADEHVDTLVARTEGWVTGLQLAGLSLQQQASTEAFLREFAGDNHNIRSYLIDEVLGGLPAEVQRFLLCTSVLERLTAPLCEAVLGERLSSQDAAPGAAPEPMAAQEILEYLEQHNLFTTPLDEHGQWYRYHTLFAELLRFQLWREMQEEIGVIQARAAQWLEEHGLSAGTRPAVSAGDGHAFARGQREPLMVRRVGGPGQRTPQEPLSEREKDVLELLASDFSYQGIAERLYISLPTVKTHVAHIYAKLGVHNREDALAEALRLGMFYH